MQVAGSRRPAPDVEPPADIDPRDLDHEVRSQLRTLSKLAADRVARHLVAAGRLVDEDPEAALAQARAARALGARVAVVREAVGEAAYAAGEWAEAIAELRTARRMTGDDSALPLLADAERALGRPDRALRLAQSPEAQALPPAEQAEMRIVEAGARRDLGQLDAGAGHPAGRRAGPARGEPWSARLWYAYADLLLALGRTTRRASGSPRRRPPTRTVATDADERLLELDGVLVLTDDEDEFPTDAAGVAPPAGDGEAGGAPGSRGPEDGDGDPTTDAGTATGEAAGLAPAAGDGEAGGAGAAVRRAGTASPRPTPVRPPASRRWPAMASRARTSTSRPARCRRPMARSVCRVVRGASAVREAGTARSRRTPVGPPASLRSATASLAAISVREAARRRLPVVRSGWAVRRVTAVREGGDGQLATDATGIAPAGGGGQPGEDLGEQAGGAPAGAGEVRAGQLGGQEDPRRTPSPWPADSAGEAAGPVERAADGPSDAEPATGVDAVRFSNGQPGDEPVPGQAPAVGLAFSDGEDQDQSGSSA